MWQEILSLFTIFICAAIGSFVGNEISLWVQRRRKRARIEALVEQQGWRQP